MRVRVAFRARGALPVSYSYWLASAVFKLIASSDEDLAAHLHSASPFKPYHFSRILAQNTKPRNGVIDFGGKTCALYFSSIREDVLNAFLDGLLTRGRMQVKKATFFPIDVEPIEYPPESFRFTTLSPVCVSIKEGKRKQYLRPDDPLFHQELVANIARKYAYFLGKPFRGNIHIRYTSFHPRMRYIKGSAVPAWDIEGEISGDRDVVRLIWDVGIGEKNALGFGMVGVCRSTS